MKDYKLKLRNLRVAGKKKARARERCFILFLLFLFLVVLTSTILIRSMDYLVHMDQQVSRYRITCTHMGVRESQHKGIRKNR